jgi:hypothetical protein
MCSGPLPKNLLETPFDAMNIAAAGAPVYSSSGVTLNPGTTAVFALEFQAEQMFRRLIVSLRMTTTQQQRQTGVLSARVILTAARLGGLFRFP